MARELDAKKVLQRNLHKAPINLHRLRFTLGRQEPVRPRRGGSATTFHKWRVYRLAKGEEAIVLNHKSQNYQGAITEYEYPGKSTQTFIHPPGSLNRVPASAGCKGGILTFGWQVTLCDPIRHVSSLSGDIELLLFTSLLANVNSRSRSLYAIASPSVVCL